MNNGFEVHLLGGDQWKSPAEVEPQLPTENAAGTCTRAVALPCTVFIYVRQKLFVLLHFPGNLMARIKALGHDCFQQVMRVNKLLCFNELLL